MSRFRYAWIVVRALCELARYDLVLARRGFKGVRQALAGQLPPAGQDGGEQADICAAVLLATCLYWKPVRCLQRSVCTMRLLRAYGVAARLVIGYRVAPFMSHAWVEVNGSIINDSSSYQQRLRTLYVV